MFPYYSTSVAPEAMSSSGNRLAKAQVVEPAVELPADPGSERQRRQHQENQHQAGTIIGSPYYAHHRSQLNDDYVGLVYRARHLFRPAAQLRPDRRQDPRITADAAENAANEANTRIRNAAAGLEGVYSRRQQRISAKREQECAEDGLENAGVQDEQHPHADRDADKSADHKRPDPANFHVVALRPDRGQVQQRAAAIDEQRGVQGIDAMQPDRRRGEPEGEAGAAGGDAADQRAEPKDGDRVERIAGDHCIRPG